MKKYEDKVGRVYLYLFSMLGLVLIVIGTTGLINLGLKTWVFDTSDPWVIQPPTPDWIDKAESLNSCENISEEDKVVLARWIEDYEEWESRYPRDYTSRQNNEAAARNLALLLVGLPLFLFHWRIVREY